MVSKKFPAFAGNRTSDYLIVQPVASRYNSRNLIPVIIIVKMMLLLFIYPFKKSSFRNTENFHYH